MAFVVWVHFRICVPKRNDYLLVNLLLMDSVFVNRQKKATKTTQTIMIKNDSIKYLLASNLLLKRESLWLTKWPSLIASLVT